MGGAPVGGRTLQDAASTSRRAPPAVERRAPACAPRLAWISRAGRSLVRGVAIFDAVDWASPAADPITPTNITASINSIPMLNGTNFKSWQENLLIVLGVMDLDLALRIDSPTPLNDQSTSDQKRDMERWERSNRMCMMIMKKAIPEAFRSTMSEKITTAKEFLTDIEKRFVKSEKAEIGELQSPKETWSLRMSSSHTCVQEEERLKQDKTESAHLASTSKDKGMKRKKDKEAATLANKRKQQQKPDDPESTGLPELPKAK
ncbi:hypothetical protein NL676_003652 [Syzygium grande]|nr:hypothetical protein NL676_003652 [Syzygium grande]